MVEGTHASISLVAQATGRSASRMEEQAIREGWRIDRVAEVDLAAKLRVVISMFTERVEILGRKALEDGGKIDKSELDGLVTIIRGLDKLVTITRTDEAAKEKQTRRDEDLRTVLQKINQRILHLAEELAAKMVDERSRRSGG